MRAPLLGLSQECVMSPLGFFVRLVCRAVSARLAANRRVPALIPASQPKTATSSAHNERPEPTGGVEGVLRHLLLRTSEEAHATIAALPPKRGLRSDASTT
jgi:hypothetical protein